MAKASVFIEKPVGQEALDLAREHFPAGSNGKRGKATSTLNALAHMYEIAEQTWPITGRGVGYRLLNRGVITTMADMGNVYGQLVEAREAGLIPWDWIVDETRDLEIGVCYASKKAAYESLLYNYAHPLWLGQPYDCEIWSEKGTVRGLIKSILDEYRLGFESSTATRPRPAFTKSRPNSSDRSWPSTSVTTIPADATCASATYLSGSSDTQTAPAHWSTFGLSR
jgi:hypothetical protein